MRSLTCPSDVADWLRAVSESLIPSCPGGRRRKTGVRDVLDAILYLLHTGLPAAVSAAGLPARGTVWRYFDKWRHNGILDRGHDLPREKVCTRTCGTGTGPRRGKHPSVDTASGGEQRGRDKTGPWTAASGKLWW